MSMRLFQILGEFTCDGLFARYSLSLWYPNHASTDVHVVFSYRENFCVAHPCVKTDHDERMDIFGVIGCRGLKGCGIPLLDIDLQEQEEHEQIQCGKRTDQA